MTIRPRFWGCGLLVGSMLAGCGAGESDTETPPPATAQGDPAGAPKDASKPGPSKKPPGIQLGKVKGVR